MGYGIVQPAFEEVLALAGRQHGVVARRQLRALGMSERAIHHRLAGGRLHRLRSGVYAVGRPEVTTHGRWMGAVLSCGPDAALSHASAAALWQIRPSNDEPIEVSVPLSACPRQHGVVIHRRTALEPRRVASRDGIPVTDPVLTLLDLATRLQRGALEAAINEADKLGLTDPEKLRAALEALAGRPGVRVLRTMLDRETFTATDSELERRLLPIARRAGLPAPRTGCYVNGYKVDFYWPDLRLVVETDGLRYHRTPSQQVRDRLRDQVHTAAGMTPLRFTHSQVVHEPEYVQATLAAVARHPRD
jgi:very-short-patch-repair endonuclease